MQESLTEERYVELQDLAAFQTHTERCLAHLGEEADVEPSYSPSGVPRAYCYCKRHAKATGCTKKWQSYLVAGPSSWAFCMSVRGDHGSGRLLSWDELSLVTSDSDTQLASDDSGTCCPAD